MEDELHALGIVREGEDIEEDRPGEVVDDKVATGDVGDNEEVADTEDLSMEEQQKLEEAAAEDVEDDE